GIRDATVTGVQTCALAIFALNRADTRVGITQDDVTLIIGREPDVLIPSDRQIPISVNEGVPIVVQDERSEAARAFQKLAESYTEQELAEQPNEPGPAPVPSGKRRFAWRS